MENLIEIQSLLNKARYHRNISCKDKKAIKICDRILKIDPNNRDAMLIKAGALNSIFKIDEAKDLINHIIKKWPNHWEAYYLLSGHYFSVHEDDKALELIDKSIELDERFDNVIQKAQMLYLIGKDNYMEFVEKAKRIDKERAENFMKNVWIYDMNGIKPSFSESLGAFKHLMRSRNKKNELKDSACYQAEGINMAPVVEWVCQNSKLINYFNPLLEKYLQSKIDQTNFGMLLDGFIFDYKLPDGKTPFELYLEKAELSFSEKEDYKKLLDNVFSAFEILEVKVDSGMRLYDILNNKTYCVKEKKGTHGAEVGSMIECRIAKVGDSFEIIGPGGFKWPAETVYSLKRLIKEGKLKDKKISLFDMLDIVLEIEDKDNTFNGIKKDLKKKLKDIGIKLNFNDLDRRVNENTDPTKAFPEIFKFNFPSMEDFEKTIDLVNKLWNLYPRKEFDGKSPSEVGGYGPKEMMLIQSLLSEGTAKISPEKYPSPKEAVKAMEKFKEKWLNTLQKELDGKTPREVILKERAQLGNPRKDISIQIQLNKIDDFDANKAEKLYFDALSAHKKGDFEESVKLLKEVVEMYPENYKAWGNMGASYASLSKKEDAIKCLRKSLAINPRYKLAKNNLKAIENYNLGIDDKELLEMAVKSEIKEDYAKALGYIKEILVQSPRSYHALFLKYRVNKKIGKPDITDLKLAFEEAKKQDASKEVLGLMEDELNELGGID